MRTIRQRPRGFTLIEMMVVVAIIGILASVAIPAYQHFTLRAKSAERGYMMTFIKRAVDDIYVRNGQLPQIVVNALPNPPGVPGTSKKRFALSYGDWPIIIPNDAAPNGDLYYQYRVVAWSLPGGQITFIQATGDLDGDGVPSVSWHTYQRVGGVTTNLTLVDDNTAF